MKLQLILSVLNSKVTLYILLGIAAFFLFDMYHANESLEQANEILEDKFDSEIQKNIALIDSLEKVKIVRSEDIQVRDQKIEHLLSEVNSILNSTKDEKAIDRINDVDSISELFSRYYPDYSISGQGSD